MEFNDVIKQFSERILSLKDTITTEESTKMSLVVPLFQLLGYDVFNPNEFCPEYIADVGIKKGEKVDYAILENGQPNILVECKSCSEQLDKHSSQLFRYFGTSPAKFGMGDVYAYYGFTLQNPNTDSASQFPIVTITAKGDDGSIIATYDQTLYFIAPTDSVSFGSVLDCNGKTPATVEFSASSGTFVSAKTSGVVPTSSFEVSNTNEIAQEYGDTSYTGEVTNKSDSDFDNVAITILLKNNGQIVYGDTTYVSDLTAGVTKPFELSEYNVPEHTEYVITAQSW